MYALAFPARKRAVTAALLLLFSFLAGCGGGLDPSYSPRAARFSTSAPLTHAKKDPDFLAYAVPESDLHQYPATRSAEYAVHGVDVSKYQGNIDWEAAKDAGVAFAFIKATEGGDAADFEVPAQLGRRQGRRDSARRLSFRLLVPAAA